jgi:ribonuclease E
LTQAPALEDEDEETDEALETSEGEQDGDEERGRSRRRRRRRRREEEPVSHPTAPSDEVVEESGEDTRELVAGNGRADGDHEDGDEEGDAERRHRRRGRRGGRRRGRRETGPEPSFDGPRPASDTVEILPALDIEEAEPALVEARERWPIGASAGAFETASLPALAGDLSPTIGGVSASESDRLPAGQFESGGFETPHAASIGEGADITEPSRTAAPPTAETEQGLPYVSETERVLETASTAAEPEKDRAPALPVEAVIEKPANPRRGWWQRLIQS